MRTNIRNSDFDYSDVKKIIFRESDRKDFIERGSENYQPLAYYKNKDIKEIQWCVNLQQFGVSDPKKGLLGGRENNPYEFLHLSCKIAFNFYRTRVRSLVMLVTNSLTH